MYQNPGPDRRAERGPYPRGYQPDPRAYPPDPRGYRPDPRVAHQGFPAREPRRRPEPEDPGLRRSGGATGNEHLTAMIGLVLLLLLAAEGFTLLQLRGMITLHFFIGMLLLGPVCLKAGSTVYRFFRYYTGSAPYRRKGPPAPLLRLLGPVIIATTAGVFGSGVMLAIAGPAGREPWLLVHKGSFVLWFCAMAVHVLAYAPRLPQLLSAEARGRAFTEGGYAGRAASALGGRGMRLALLIGSLVLGLVLALLTVHLAGRWQFGFFSGG